MSFRIFGPVIILELISISDLYCFVSLINTRNLWISAIIRVFFLSNTIHY